MDADVTGKGFAQENVAEILRQDEQGTDGHGDAAGITADISFHQLQKCVAWEDAKEGSLISSETVNDWAADFKNRETRERPEQSDFEPTICSQRGKLLPVP